MARRFSVRKEVEFDAGHRVPGHKNKCRNPHGHRYRVVVHVTGPLVLDTGASDEGMVMDFGDIKTALMKIHDKYDHGFLVYEKDEQLRSVFFDLGNNPKFGWNAHLVPYIPTAENLSFAFYNFLSLELDSKPTDYHQIQVSRVDVYETPTSVASYPSIELPLGFGRIG